MRGIDIDVTRGGLGAVPDRRQGHEPNRNLDTRQNVTRAVSANRRSNVNHAFWYSRQSV